MKKNDFWSPEGLERRFIGIMMGIFSQKLVEKNGSSFFLGQLLSMWAN